MTTQKSVVRTAFESEWRNDFQCPRGVFQEVIKERLVHTKTVRLSVSLCDVVSATKLRAGFSWNSV
jgi:hypothetical protein